MFIKVIILIVIFFLGIYCTWHQYEKKNYKGVAFVIIGSICIGMFTSWITDLMRPLLPYPDTSITSSAPIDDNEIDSTDKAEIIQPTSAPTDDIEIDSTDNAEFIQPTESNKLIRMKNISDERSVNGSLVRQNQKDEYVYVASTDGTYHFYTDLSSGGTVLIWLSDENSEKLKYGENALTIDLNAGKTYILSIEYCSGPCEYTINIGVPIPITDVTGRTSISGSIVYQDQKDRYRYTAAITGTYRFYTTNLSAAGEVRVRISGENGHSINDRTNALTIDLEKGKTYILSIEYWNGPCDYTVSIGVPIPITDITGRTSISGSIVYQDQKDRYRYTAAITGTYRFYTTNLSAAGEVRVRISGENGHSINDRTNALTIDLEKGKTYILSIEYRNGPCDYTVSIGVPIPITDITGRTSISGSIVYQDQKDRYRYTAAITGTYRFYTTNLSAAGEVRVRISGENGHSINDRTNALTIDLEKGKTYILSIEYRNGPCDYTVSIGVPTPITDNTGHTPISGIIGYRDQNDRYYIVPISGTYCFNANLSAGGEVRMRISGENGISLGYGTNKLTMNLETGNIYF